MNRFDEIIGYDNIKAEVRRYCDVLKNLDKYKALGVDTPRGLILYGDPGVGKSLMAKCLIDESGLKSYIVRKDKPDGEFITHIQEVFKQAKETAPSIIMLDDMDKFANEDDQHKDAEEYVAVQACID
ncbi:MAG: AAA family ATPase, partial [Pseudobutyrivibrio sp.]|nr:AAA family ATPase [Pseudobutyrivibrio sp.]